MNRVEFLEKLEEKVINEPLLQCKYYGYVNDKKCFCVLGHAYNILGKEKLLETMDYEEVGKVYSALDSDLLINESCGLSIQEFTRLQSINDGSDIEDRNKIGVLNYIKELKKEG